MRAWAAYLSPLITPTAKVVATVGTLLAGVNWLYDIKIDTAVLKADVSSLKQDVAEIKRLLLPEHAPVPATLQTMTCYPTNPPTCDAPTPLDPPR